jgi:hypothetical protein
MALPRSPMQLTCGTPSPLKVQVQRAWLSLCGRCWTSDRGLWCGLPSHVLCPLCDVTNETSDHLALQCPFARCIWEGFSRRAGLEFCGQPASRLVAWRGWYPLPCGCQGRELPPRILSGMLGCSTTVTLPLECLMVLFTIRAFGNRVGMGLWEEFRTVLATWC